MPTRAGELALVIATAALEKKAVAVEILDVVGKVDYADFLVLMTGRSNRHVDSLAQAIDEACAKMGSRSLGRRAPAASWVLIDFGDVVVHVFQEDARGLYDIEGLWLDAKRLPVPAKSPKRLQRARGCASSFLPWARSKSAVFAKPSTTISAGCGVICR